MKSYDDNPIKQMAFEAYWNGYKVGYHVEEYERIDEKVCEMKFEQWWSVNYEQ